MFLNRESNTTAAVSVLGRILSSYGVKTQKELSEVTGIPANTISNWVQRGSVPGNIILKCALDNGVDAGWLVTGEFVDTPEMLHQDVNLKGKALYEQILASGGRAVLRRMLDAYGFSTQKELGELLDIAPGTISTWIRRDFFPGDVVVACALDTGVSLEWLAIGKGSPHHLGHSDVSDAGDTVLVPRKTLKAGKLQVAGDWKADNAFLPAGVHSPLLVEGSTASWLVDTGVTCLGNGRWLLDIDGRNDIYDVSLLPGKKISVTGTAAQFQCGADEVSPVGLVVFTITRNV
ncbi:helix-turn-helix domain-containing protein [Lonsdalea quercina]|uniref:helix-turn-helix domain-containing protein n=1 Tax=Lonsdalea quercina TaxID=71657 RepID=UPI003975EEB6